MIINKIDNKKYIGQSVDIRRRKIVHRGALAKGKHSNSYLQSAWDEYGKLAFTTKIVEIFTSEVSQFFKDQREIYWISFYNTLNHNYGYNLDPGGFKGTIETTKSVEEILNTSKEVKISIEVMEKILNKKYKQGPIPKKIICITTNKIFNTIKEGENFYKISKGGISACCSPNNKHNFAGKHPETKQLLKWMYYDDYLKLQDQVG